MVSNPGSSPSVEEPPTFHDEYEFGDSSSIGHTLSLEPTLSPSIPGNSSTGIGSAVTNTPARPRENVMLQHQRTQPATSFADELKCLSLEATAERHLGSTSGVSFAKLTQMVLRRLNPDKADFVFATDVNHESDHGGGLFDFNFPLGLGEYTLFERLNESISVHPSLFGDIGLTDSSIQPSDSIASLPLPSDAAHVNRLVDFYFAHSHTLYPIIHRGKFLKTLQEVRGSPGGPIFHPPLTMFRIWMVLAIGSTAYSAVSLAEESESRQYYNEALRYLEQAMSADMVCTLDEHSDGLANPLLTAALQAALEVIMLQVSYSFFNQLGPSW